jgi:hypothetical protein
MIVLIALFCEASRGDMSKAACNAKMAVDFRDVCPCCRAARVELPPLAQAMKALQIRSEAHELLRRVLVCITVFFATGQHFIERVLIAVAEYRTVARTVEIVVLVDGDGALRLRELLFTRQLSQLLHPLEIVAVNMTALSHPFMLAHQYKAIFSAAMKRPAAEQPTTFIYLEEDIVLSALALAHWALDAPALSRYGLQRGFYRYENGRLGCQWLADERQPTAVSKMRRLVLNASHLEGKSWRSRVDAQLIYQLDANSSRAFVTQNAPYSALTVATRAQLVAYMASHLWNRTKYERLGVREMAACGIRNMAPLVVPFNSQLREMLPESGVWHSSNKYAYLAKTEFGKICVSEGLA